MNFQDRNLVCSDCNSSFVFSAQEQEMYYERRYANAPKRCPACRQARKTRQAAETANTFGANSFGARTYNPAPRQMFPAVCSECGKATTVPFEPKLDRPVYCLDCYRKVKANR